MRARMPISLWLQWRAWFNIQGPPQWLRDDYNATDLAFRMSIRSPEDERGPNDFLRPWARPSDYRQWVNLGEDPKPEEFVIDS